MSEYAFEAKRTVVIKLSNGEDVLQGLESELARLGIQHGIIQTGIGSTSAYHIHVVDSMGLPVENIYFRAEAPFDIVNMQGYILNGRVHAHISLGDNRDGTQRGGHLEIGCRVLTFCAISVMETTAIGEDLDQA